MGYFTYMHIDLCGVDKRGPAHTNDWWNAMSHAPTEEEQSLSLTINNQIDVPIHFGVSKVDTSTEKL